MTEQHTDLHDRDEDDFDDDFYADPEGADFLQFMRASIDLYSMANGGVPIGEFASAFGKLVGEQHRMMAEAGSGDVYSLCFQSSYAHAVQVDKSQVN